MRSTSILCRTAPYLAAVLTLAAAGGVWAQADAEPTAPAKPTSALSPEEHWAKGEAEYAGEWIPIPKLFEKYVAERNRLRYVREHGTEAQDRLNKLHQEIASIKSEQRQEQMPIRQELGKARAELRRCSAILRKSAPVKPKLIPRPSQPRRPRSSYGHGSSSSSRGMSGWYEQAQREWERQCDAVDRENEKRMQQYQRDLQEYQAEQSKAKAEVPKLEATIRKCMEELGEVEETFEDKQEPTLQKSENATEAVRAHLRQVEAMQSQVEALANALRVVPETIRFQHGILEFEGEFHTVPELRRLHSETQADIDRVRNKLKAECEQLDLPFPEDWQHPQQKRMDAIKDLLDQADAARKAAKA